MLLLFYLSLNSSFFAFPSSLSWKGNNVVTNNYWQLINIALNGLNIQNTKNTKYWIKCILQQLYCPNIDFITFQITAQSDQVIIIFDTILW